MSDHDAQPVAMPLDRADHLVLIAVADELIPAAHGMPSAGTVLDARRVGFVLGARPDLVRPLSEAARPELGDSVAARLAALADEPEHLDALQLVVVAGYYSDAGVRDRIGYPGQVARPVNPFDYPEYMREGLVDGVVNRGRIWRDPAEPGQGA